MPQSLPLDRIPDSTVLISLREALQEAKDVSGKPENPRQEARKSPNERVEEAKTSVARLRQPSNCCMSIVQMQNESKSHWKGRQDKVVIFLLGARLVATSKGFFQHRSFLSFRNLVSKARDAFFANRPCSVPLLRHAPEPPSNHSNWAGGNSNPQDIPAMLGSNKTRRRFLIQSNDHRLCDCRVLLAWKAARGSRMVLKHCHSLLS